MRRICYFLLMILLLILSSKSVVAYSCQCEENRTIRLTKPLMRGEDIKIIQLELKKIGLYKGIIDGIYGPDSVKAVNDFQKIYDLKQDGVVDQNVWIRLRKMIESEIRKHLSSSSKPPGKDILIEINLNSRVLTIIVDGKPYKNYPVTIGKDDSKTPVGEWVIRNKYVRVDEGPLGSRWMGLSIPWGVYGIHGTNKPWEIGQAASLGCVRLHNQHVEEIFEWVGINTRVKITGPWPEIKITSPLQPGESNREVQELQRKLRRTGFYTGYLNGKYGKLTENSIKEIEAIFALKIDGIADDNILQIIDRLSSRNIHFKK